MVRVKVIKGTSNLNLESMINAFLQTQDFTFGSNYKIHYSTSHTKDDEIHYSALIEYEGN